MPGADGTGRMPEEGMQMDFSGTPSDDCPAILATGGRVVRATWHKLGRDRALRFTGPGGSALKVAPGRTWLELVPVKGAVKVH